MGVRTKGTWEEWVKFFLKGVSENSEEACNTAREIIRLKENLIKRLYENRVASIYAVGLIDLIFDTPMISVKDVVGRLEISTVAANSLVKKFEKVGILKEITGKERYKKFIFKDYVEIISRGTQLD
jgi:Fic family protein